MSKKNTTLSYITFILELFFISIIPIIVCWGVLPTFILNSNPFFELLELLGIISGFLLPLAIPVGILGIIFSNKIINFKKTTLILSIINVTIGSIWIIIWIMVFYNVIFNGVSV